MVSIHTGLSPREHGVMDTGPLSPTQTTLAEQLQDLGYATAAIGLNPMLRPEMTGLDQGFQHLDWQPRDILRKSYLGTRLLARLFPNAWPYNTNTTGLTCRAIQWYAKNPNVPTLEWLHYFDPHEDYEPPVPFRPEGNPPCHLPASHFSGLTQGIRAGHRARDLKSHGWIRELYRGEVCYVDYEFGLLIDFLRQTELFDDMAIVLVSDHGEEFWEHDAFGHGHTLFSELIDVPLIIRPSGSFVPGCVSVPVCTADLTPTILAMTGHDMPDAITSRSLLGALDEHPAKPLFASNTLYFKPQSAVNSGRMEIHPLAHFRP